MFIADLLNFWSSAGLQWAAHQGSSPAGRVSLTGSAFVCQVHAVPSSSMLTHDFVLGLPGCSSWHHAQPQQTCKPCWGSDTPSECLWHVMAAGGCSHDETKAAEQCPLPGAFIDPHTTDPYAEGDKRPCLAKSRGGFKGRQNLCDTLTCSAAAWFLSCQVLCVPMQACSKPLTTFLDGKPVPIPMCLPRGVCCRGHV